ncbi:hypothetical protein QOT17_008051 [Balamuthia mandrillaris]
MWRRGGSSLAQPAFARCASAAGLRSCSSLRRCDGGMPGLNAAAGRLFSSSTTVTSGSRAASFSTATTFGYSASFTTTAPTKTAAPSVRSVHSVATEAVSRPAVVSGVCQHGPLALELLDEEEDDDGRS